MKLRQLGRARSGLSPRTRWPMHAFASCGLALALLAGCDSTSDRVTNHLDRADAFLAESRGREALLELGSAALLAPNDPAIVLRVAETSLEYGYDGDAVDFYRDYHQLVPEDDARTIELARLICDDAPKEANELLAVVLAKDPQNADAWLASAYLSLARDDTRGALRDVYKARSIDPENPEVYWMLARSHEARIRAVRRRRGPRIHSPRTFNDAIEAYEEYLERNGEHRLMAMLHRADLLASLPGQRKKARHAYSNTVRATFKTGTHHERVRVLRRAARYGRHNGLARLESNALRRLVGISPHDIEAWEQLAAVKDRDQAEHAKQTYERMLRRNPQNAGAYVAYSRYLTRETGLGSGLKFLRERRGGELDDAVLLTGIMKLQWSNGRGGDAAQTLRELRERFPERQSTEYLVAQDLIKEKRWSEAIEILAATNERRETKEGQRLMARAALGLGRYEDAMKALGRAMALDRTRSADLMRLRAKILSAQGDYRAAALVLRRIERVERLTSDDRLMMAVAYYDARAGGVGRRMLIDLLEIDPTHRAAALEFARRETVQPEMRRQASAHLERALEEKPDDPELLMAATRLYVQDGHIDPALIRINKAVGHSPRSGSLYLLRARVLLSVQRFKEARADVERAVEVDPGAREEALEVLSEVYAAAPNPQSGIEALEQAASKGALSPDRMVLLARLYLRVGDRQMALATYERALSAGSRMTMLKNDLAYLLAQSGEDLDRALVLAQAASEAAGEGLSAADTLGYVYLRSGQPEAAFWQFRFVTANADPPVAEYHYHLALALLAMERENEAGKALARALDIDPQFSDAEVARAHLARISAAAPEAPGDPVQPRSG